MNFSSSYALFYFLPLILILYLTVFKKYKNRFLLIASLVLFFIEDQFYIFLMILSALVDHFTGLSIHKSKIANKINKAKIALAISLILNLSILIYFKINFLFNSFSGELIQFHLPLGISFYTLQSMSYSIDIYQGKIFPVKRFTHFLNYISMFPQIFAGPIVRFKDIKQDLFSQRQITIDQITDGLKRFIYGLAKKELIADNVAYLTNYYYQGQNLDFAEAWMAVICFFIQLYYDFSGYSDMAIGTGKILGFKFPENFDNPYRSKSVREYWTRWHISLSFWLRDYLFIPLGGSQKGRIRYALNLLIVFIACGMWHSPKLHSLLWAVINASSIIFEKVLAKFINFKIPSFIKVIYTLFICAISHMLIRVDNFDQAFMILSSMVDFNNISILPIIFLKYRLYYLTCLIAGIILCFPIKEYLLKKVRSLRVEKIILIILFLISTIEVISRENTIFYYFRF